MANLYTLGQLARCTGTYTDENGDAADPTAVYVKIMDPSDNTDTYTYGVDAEVIKDGTGIYHIDISTDEAGMWWARWYATGTGEAADEQYFYVEDSQLSQPDVYFSVIALKARLDITDTTDDEMLATMGEGISRAIDAECKRRFYTTTSDETRYFTAQDTDEVWTGDLLSVTTLKTDANGDGTFETTWTSSDYDLWPWNASLEARPYRRIVTKPLGSYSFVTTQKGIQVVGKFGFASSNPPQIREAALLAAERLWKRKDAILGIVGSPETGELRQVLREDPEIQLLLTGMRDRGHGGLV